MSEHLLSTAIEFARHLGRGDQCRLVDQVLLEMFDGVAEPLPHLAYAAPVAALIDIQDDAASWCEDAPRDVRSAFFMAIWFSMDDAQRAKALAWCRDRVSDKEKAA